MLSSVLHLLLLLLPPPSFTSPAPPSGRTLLPRHQTLLYQRVGNNQLAKKENNQLSFGTDMLGHTKHTNMLQQQQQTGLGKQQQQPGIRQQQQQMKLSPAAQVQPQQRGGRNPANVKNRKLNNQFTVIHHETEQQIDELKQKVSDKEFEKMTKNLNRFCGNLASCAPILIGALQVLSNV